MNAPTQIVQRTQSKLDPAAMTGSVEAAATVVDTPPLVPEPKPVDIPTAQRWHAECLLRYRQANERQMVARGRFNIALRDWLSATMQIISPEELRRQHINAETKLRADVLAGRVSPRKTPDQPGPSAIDRLAFYSKDQGRRPGGGNSFRRGGVGQNELLRRQAEAAFRAKQNPGS